METLLCHSLVPYTIVEQENKSVSCSNNFVGYKGNALKLILLLVAYFFIFQIGAQNITNPHLFVSRIEKQVTGFPQSFIGNWKGKLQWMVAGKPDREFTMQLSIQPLDTTGQYGWQIIYGDKEQDNRPYILKPVDTAKGHWVIDEMNGIILDSYIHGNSLHGAFTVNGNTIVDNYRVENDTIQVEFFTIRLGDKNTTGKGSEDSPIVDSYRITGYQTGVLTRIQ